MTDVVPYTQQSEVPNKGLTLVEVRLNQPSLLARVSFVNYYTASIGILCKYSDSSADWQPLLPIQKLMPNPHCEDASQQSFVFPLHSTDGRKIAQLLLVIRQPSAHWISYGLKDLKLHTSPGIPQRVETAATQAVQQPPQDQLATLERPMGEVARVAALLRIQRLRGRCDVDGVYDIDTLDP